MHDRFRQALIECDVTAVRQLWAFVSPQLPQPKDNAETLIGIHVARTGAKSIPVKDRLYSHAWLTERALPSQLPDHLKQSAERVYPSIVDGVGIAVKATQDKHDLGKALTRAMSDAVADCYANGDRDPVLVKAQMMMARAKVYRGA